MIDDVSGRKHLSIKIMTFGLLRKQKLNIVDRTKFGILILTPKKKINLFQDRDVCEVRDYVYIYSIL
jgi:hypothetical protein